MDGAYFPWIVTPSIDLYTNSSIFDPVIRLLVKDPWASWVKHIDRGGGGLKEGTKQKFGPTVAILSSKEFRNIFTLFFFKKAAISKYQNGKRWAIMSSNMI